MGSNPGSFTSLMCGLGQVTLISFDVNIPSVLKRTVVVPSL